jgi:hypothetical protein
MVANRPRRKPPPVSTSPPGQRYDIIFSTPNTTGTWYPQFEYKRLRDGSSFGTAYARLTV